MKKLLLLLVAIGGCFSAEAYEVENGKQQGFEVIADNYVYIVTPDNQKIQITTLPFVGDGFSLPPVEAIRCTWDPSHTWVGIFVTVKQITGIYFFNLKTRSLLKKWADVDWSEYPKWFGRKQWFIHTYPVKWSGNKLLLDSLIKFRDDNTIRHLEETIIIDNKVIYRVVGNDIDRLNSKK